MVAMAWRLCSFVYGVFFFVICFGSHSAQCAEVSRQRHHEQEVTALAFSSRGIYLAAREREAISIYRECPAGDLAYNYIGSITLTEPAEVPALAFCPRSDCLVVNSGRSLVFYRMTEDRIELFATIMVDEPLRAYAFHGASDCLIVGMGNRICFLDLPAEGARVNATELCVRELELNPSEVIVGIASAKRGSAFIVTTHHTEKPQSTVTVYSCYRACESKTCHVHMMSSSMLCGVGGGVSRFIGGCLTPCGGSFFYGTQHSLSWVMVAHDPETSSDYLADMMPDMRFGKSTFLQAIVCSDDLESCSLFREPHGVVVVSMQGEAGPCLDILDVFPLLGGFCASERRFRCQKGGSILFNADQRINCIALHPTKRWLLVGLNNGLYSAYL